MQHHQDDASPPTVDEAITLLLVESSTFSSTQLAAALGVTRQAVHRHLTRRLERGELISTGRARGTRYSRPEGPVTHPRAPERRPASQTGPLGGASLTAEAPPDRSPARTWTFPTLALDESAAWSRVWAESPAVAAAANPAAERILSYAFSELLNNAIDHSGAKQTEVQFGSDPSTGSLLGTVSDRGLGAFESVRSHLDLLDLFEAAQELSKGKITTAPSNHTGEGLFFLSKAADRFELEANGLCWIVDNLRDDQTLRAAPAAPGTRARLWLSPNTERSLTRLFDQFTTEFAFDRTRIVLRLFEYGTDFVSRSEAKRLTRHLDRFREVLLDFKGVESVGQGFVDELFRVWATAHPDVTLLPENTAPEVEFMIRRGLGHRPS